jgi:hypothetical protein
LIPSIVFRVDPSFSAHLMYLSLSAQWSRPVASGADIDISPNGERFSRASSAATS